MSQCTSTLICTFNLDNGYILKNFFNIISVRAVPTFTILEDKIIAENTTADGTIYGKSYLHGDEIGLEWHIPKEKRRLSLKFDSSQNNVSFNRIKKKNEARITIAQNQNNPNCFDFDSPESSDDFSIFLSCGNGGDRREGLQSIAAKRVRPDDILIREPDPQKASLLIIPIQAFRQMMDSFSKCKKQSIRLCFYPNNKSLGGRPGIIITTDMEGGKAGCLLEKYGEIPDNEEGPPIVNMNIQFDERRIVRNSNSARIVIEKELGPNEFVFDSDKVSVFNKLANMHNEGNVRFYYQEGHHLVISHRFGGFGECSIALHNKYVNILNN